MSNQENLPITSPNRFDPERLSRTDTRAMLGILRAATNISAAAEAALRDAGAGMRGSEWDVLVALGAYGPLRPVELVRRTWMSANMQTVHAILGRLEGRGLIEREPHPLHRRGVIVRLSEDGERTVARLTPVVERKVINAFAGHFDDEELEQIADLTERL